MFRKIAGILVLIVITAALVWVVRREQGYFSPVISPDAKHVYFVERSTSGLVWGFGIESFTPPAHAFLWRDRFELRRVPLAGGRAETVQALPPSPLEGKIISQYRGRVFSVPQAVIRFSGGRLEYQVAVSRPREPFSQTWTAGSSSQAWTERAQTFSPGDDMVGEAWEALAVPGRESFPCAVAAHNFLSGELRVLIKTEACDALYPNGIEWAALEPHSRARDVLRRRRIRELDRQLRAENLAHGLNEGAAILEANRRLQEMGYYAKPPQLVARPAPSAAGAPVFVITEGEFQAGLFPDIEQAIAAPGTEIEKRTGDYVIHRDYSASARLNEFLRPGGKRFYVQRGGRIYQLTVTDARPAFR